LHSNKLNSIANQAPEPELEGLWECGLKLDLAKRLNMKLQLWSEWAEEWGPVHTGGKSLPTSSSDHTYFISLCITAE